MKKLTHLAPWLLAGVLAAILLNWAFPRAYPLFDRERVVSKDTAEAVALERLADLEPIPTGATVVTVLDTNLELEYRLQTELPRLGAEAIRGSRLGRGLETWRVTVYPPGAGSANFSHRASITPSGEVTELRLKLRDDDPGGVADAAAARPEADAFLRDQGVDLALYEEPVARAVQLQSRTDLSLRYRDRERLLGDDHPYGLEVFFAGDRLAGYSTYYDDPEREAIRTRFQTPTLLNQAWVFITLLLLPLVAIPFVRRYHAGEIGVRRGVQISAVIFGLGALVMIFCAKVAGSGWQIGALTRPQVTAVVGFQLLVLFFFPLAIMSFLSWSVGESLCRVRAGRRLAAFDALFKGALGNATFARAALRGLVSGLVILAATWSVLVPLRAAGIWTSGAFLLGPWWESTQWFSIPLLGFTVAYSLYRALFGQLLLVSSGTKLLGRWAGPVAASIVSGLLFFPPVIVFPFAWSVPLWIVSAAAYVFVFLRYGLFTAWVAGLTSGVVAGALPLLGAADPSIQLQASVALLFMALPLLLSCRHLLSDEEFVYRYEDVPPHVRRIVERERQRVELETARGIQSSILPELPPVLNGVELSHVYQPASEVGGDFYDVLALEDGRLAVAVGDVAGHGVSSGLVMSMAKSALAVQVTFDPEVEAVFATLNRMVYQSARRRLLTTLCYVLLDPVRRQMFYASAGHLFPYRVSPNGTVLALESISYPLGVRSELEVRVREAQLQPRDCLVLFSDGVVEAHAEGSDELYGFDRFEESLARHAAKTVDRLRDGLLADLDLFTRSAPREDDLTLLVLRVP